MTAFTLSAFVLMAVAAAQLTGQAPQRSEERRGEFGAALENGTLRVGIDCSGRRQCNVRFGNTVHAVTDSGSVKPTGRTSGEVFIYLDPAGGVVAGSTVALQCNGCKYARGVTQFPANSIPLFSWTVVQGAFTPGSGRDFRAELSTKNINAGSGMMVTDDAGTATVAIDPAVISQHVIVPPKTSASACSGGEFSFDADYYYVCVARNKWKRVALTDF